MNSNFLNHSRTCKSIHTVYLPYNITVTIYIMGSLKLSFTRISSHSDTINSDNIKENETVFIIFDRFLCFSIYQPSWVIKFQRRIMAAILLNPYLGYLLYYFNNEIFWNRSTLVWLGLVVFYGISPPVGYLIQNPAYTHTHTHTHNIYI